MGTKLFLFLGSVLAMAAIAAIHGHMTSKMGVVTKGYVYLLIHKFERLIKA